jgi:hypothetical protein
MRHRLAVAAIVCAAVTSPLRAQLRADPGTVINGRIAVRVYVTLSDDETSYAPIGGVSLRFFRTTADTVVTLRTDDAGTATAMLAPGEYRLMTTSPVDWKGGRYSWNRLVSVRAGLPTIELSAALAVREASPVAAAVTGPVALPEGGRSVLRRDPSAATMYSFFLPGSGHMYAGERVKGGALMATALVGVVVAGTELSCATAPDCEPNTGGMALGAAGMIAFFGSWLYSVMDAGDAAERFNVSHGLVATLRPMVPDMRAGRTRVGVSLALSR